jgi:hypothetical protein
MTGTWATWNLIGGDQFRPPPPHNTAHWNLAEMREVYETGQNLTLEQQQMASFWEDKPGTPPPGHWNIIALRLVREVGFPAATPHECSRRSAPRRPMPSFQPGILNTPTDPFVP